MNGNFELSVRTPHMLQRTYERIAPHFLLYVVGFMCVLELYSPEMITFIKVLSLIAFCEMQP